MLLGAHESTSGGLPEAFARALADGAEAAGFPASVHSSYLINLGSGPGELREKSIAAFIDELERCDRLGVPHLIVHPGSNSETAKGLQLIAEALDRTFAAHKGRCLVLLETAAGQGSSLGRTFEELLEIRERCRSPERVAICLDTCHVF